MQEQEFFCMLRHEENLCLFVTYFWGRVYTRHTVCITCDMFTLIHFIHCATLASIATKRGGAALGLLRSVHSCLA